ncbi:hypothetical protein [Bacillus cereus]|uniref:hypothetical protein n=1 Tax=Bacillus cereus TaxID=1396 RepID=UPI0018F4A833|nr:hypothetical protein [Bacillus cereus]MBJ8153495.1 hypothetical protein [Bacillus cereus]
MKKNMKIIRYGTVAEQKYINEFSDMFDLLVINANMISYASASISKFVSTQSNLNYIIDPITHALQHKIELITSSKGEIKKSFAKMIGSYAEFVQEKVLERKNVLTPLDFEKEDNIEKFVESVIDFQKNHVIENVRDQDFYEYLEYAGVDFQPLWYIIPYFSMNTLTMNKWLPVNLRLIEYAISKYPKDKLAMQIVIEKDILREKSSIEELVGYYRDTGVERVLIWIDDFSAFESSEELIHNFCYLIKLFNQANIAVYNLYGDFFSILLCHEDSPYQLNGVCHGIEYGEKRAVVPVGGGIPINKYYYYPLHQRISYGESATALTVLGYIPDNNYLGYYSDICGCETCKSVIGKNMNNFEQYGGSKAIEIKRKNGIVNREFPTTEAKGLCIKHFLNSKNEEWKELNLKSLDEILAELLTTGEKYKEIRYDTSVIFDLWNRSLKSEE